MDKGRSAGDQRMFFPGAVRLAETCSRLPQMKERERGKEMG